MEISENDLLFDTHAHYDDEKFDPDRDEVLASLRENGIGFITDIGCSFDSIPKAKEIAGKYPFAYFTAGIHPNEADKADEREDTIGYLKTVLSDEKAVAVGEIGLDYHWDEPSRELQKKWFEKQMALAEELSLPVCIHDREAHGDTMDILRKFPSVTGILHSFSGSPEMARELIARGYFISFSGVLTFKNAAKLPEVAKEVPLDRMLLETDCPYLAPHPHRGERNSSILMCHTAEKLAQIKGMTFEEIARITTENAKRVYKIK